MLVYVPQITPRVRFTLDVILGRLLNISYDITTDLSVFESCQTEKLAYAPVPIDKECKIWIEAHPLLFEESFHQQQIIPTPWNGIQLFFPTSNGAFPIDIFAVSFYLLSRYEEYNPDSRRDQHNRFPITESVSYQLKFYRKPVVNMLAYALGEEIQKHYPFFLFQKPEFKTLTTYDVDIAYQYRGKGLFRFIGSLGKSFLHLDFKTIGKNIQGALGIKHEDSFDRFQLHKDLFESENSKPIHFILTTSFSKYNKNISPKSKTFKELIRFLKGFSEIGLHPSYLSSERPELFIKEKNLLEEIGNIQVRKSRQHYLRFQFPSTFEALIEAGIHEDYSLGWHDEAGFRLSTTIPIPFFNIQTNSIRPLTLVPLTAMDGALYHCYETLEECKNVVEELRQKVQVYGGTFVILYHNNSKKHLF
ncbi:MAG TPA: polysaccharide deacetylase family protein [Bacteroidales bacterium]|nr:polysaccharide deacetylase family protein [Bacteroidales bacterium]